MGTAGDLLVYAYSNAFGPRYQPTQNCSSFLAVYSQPGTPNGSLIRLMGSLHRAKLMHSYCGQSYIWKGTRCRKWWHRAANNGLDYGREVDSGNKLDIDKLLAIAEVVCIAPSAVFSIGYAMHSTIQNSPNVALSSSTAPVNKYVNGFLTWQILPLLGALIISAIIRTRQWQRITRGHNDSGKFGGLDLSLVDRVRKLEEDVGSSVTIIRVLSRQLEKLGVRFRVTRQTLRKPINETAVLAQKTSEAVRSLANQEDILENELHEIQHILLAMQEQQRKQLELILALGKAGRLQKGAHWSVESNKKPEATQGYSKTKVSSLTSLEANPGRSIVSNGIGIIQKIGRLQKSFTQRSDGISDVQSVSCNSSKEKEHLPGASKSQPSGCFGNSQAPQLNNTYSDHVNNAESQIFCARSESGQGCSRVPGVKGTVQDISSKPEFLNSFTTSQDFTPSNSQERDDDSRTNQKEKIIGMDSHM